MCCTKENHPIMHLKKCHVCYCILFTWLSDTTCYLILAKTSVTSSTLSAIVSLGEIVPQHIEMCLSKFSPHLTFTLILLIFWKKWLDQGNYRKQTGFGLFSRLCVISPPLNIRFTVFFLVGFNRFLNSA